MTTIGLCTHFSETDEWAFEYTLKLAKKQAWQLNICHWLYSPYLLRRDQIQDVLVGDEEVHTVTPDLLNTLELRLREYFDPKLGDFTDVAFKLCEGQYQVELVRCFRKNLLDLVVMGYPSESDSDTIEQPIEEFALKCACPILLVGRDGPQTFLLNPTIIPMLDQLDLPEGSWQVLEPVAF